MVYEPELEGLLNSTREVLNRLQSFDIRAEDDDNEQETGWDWDAPLPPAIMRGHQHHHHHHRHGLEMFGMVGGESFRGMLDCHVHYRKGFANNLKPLVYALTALHQIRGAKTTVLTHCFNAKAPETQGIVKEMALARVSHALVAARCYLDKVMPSSRILLQR